MREGIVDRKSSHLAAESALCVNGQVIGGLGVSGDTACADHAIAYRTCHLASLDGTPNSDNIAYLGAGELPHDWPPVLRAERPRNCDAEPASPLRAPAATRAGRGPLCVRASIHGSAPRIPLRSCARRPLPELRHAGWPQIDKGRSPTPTPSPSAI
jgi:hypothetical protein